MAEEQEQAPSRFLDLRPELQLAILSHESLSIRDCLTVGSLCRDAKVLVQRRMFDPQLGTPCVKCAILRRIASRWEEMVDVIGEEKNENIHWIVNGPQQINLAFLWPSTLPLSLRDPMRPPEAPEVALIDCKAGSNVRNVLSAVRDHFSSVVCEFILDKMGATLADKETPIFALLRRQAGDTQGKTEQIVAKAHLDRVYWSTDAGFEVATMPPASI